MIDPTLDKIAERCRKLLALTKSGNEHEAAQAASRAAALMAQYNLVEAELAIDAGQAYTPEPIARAVPLIERYEDRTSKRSAWRETLASAAARSVGVRMYYRGRHPHAYGRESATQTWRYLTLFLCAEVDRLTAEQAHGAGRAFANAFRLGCAQRIAARLEEQTTEVRQARRVEVQRAQEAIDAGTAGSSSMALARIDQAEREVNQGYAALSANFGTAATIGNVSCGGGYTAGRAAGERANLGGKARAGLGTGQGRLK